MAPPDPLSQCIRDQIEGLGYELVDLRIGGPRHRQSVRVRIDRPGSRPGAGVTADECAAVARAVRAAVATAVPGGGLERLEVSSPGIERPVRWPEHWRRYIGSRVRVRAADVRGRPVASILALPDDAHVTLRFADGTERTLALDDIIEATLVVDWSQMR
jgi:ribosome maturation factor RimP